MVHRENHGPSGDKFRPVYYHSARQMCTRCHGLGKVPDWSNWDEEFGEPNPKPCPDCEGQKSVARPPDVVLDPVRSGETLADIIAAVDALEPYEHPAFAPERSGETQWDDKYDGVPEDVSLADDDRWEPPAGYIVGPRGGWTTLESVLFYAKRDGVVLGLRAEDV